jgi:hypothetical protein
MKEYKLTIFADYYQFYIQDEVADGNLSDSWNKEAEERLLAITEGTIGIGTFSNEDVLVDLIVFDEYNNEYLKDEEYWDKINECTINIKSNKLVIAGCTDYFPEAERIEVKGEILLIKVYYKQNPEHYKVVICPTNKIEKIKIIK